MSYDVLSKDKLEYTLGKLKEKIDASSGEDRALIESISYDSIYNSDETYSRGDLVFYSKTKEVYKSLLDNNRDNNPTDESSIYWVKTGIVNEFNNFEGGASTADAVSYDNETSGLSATNVQNGIDEVVEKIDENAIDYSLDDTGNGITIKGGFSGKNRKYSKEEQIIGEWIDGKPIHSIYLDANVKLLQSRWVDFNVSDLNIDYLVYARVYCSSIIPSAHIYFDQNAQMVKVNGTYWTNEVQTSGLYLEYTKTTD